MRVGLFAKNPPVTRVVLDLKGPQTYQFSAFRQQGRGQAGGRSSRAQVHLPPSRQIPARRRRCWKLSRCRCAHAPIPPAPPAKVEPKVEVHYENGRMSIWANRASLADVLNEVHRKTGADVLIPAGAEQEQVVTSIGPAPLRDVLASLLNGSRFNFIVVGYDGDPGRLKSLILTPRGQSGSQPRRLPTPSRQWRSLRLRAPKPTRRPTLTNPILRNRRHSRPKMMLRRRSSFGADLSFRLY